VEELPQQKEVVEAVSEQAQTYERDGKLEAAARLREQLHLLTVTHLLTHYLFIDFIHSYNILCLRKLIVCYGRPPRKYVSLGIIFFRFAFICSVPIVFYNL
jgi:hypothetical protein